MHSGPEGESPIGWTLAVLSSASCAALHLNPFVIDIVAEGKPTNASTGSWRIPLSAGEVSIHFSLGKGAPDSLSALISAADATPRVLSQVLAFSGGPESGCLSARVDMARSTGVSVKARELRAKVLADLLGQLEYVVQLHGDAMFVRVPLDAGPAELLESLLRLTVYVAHFLGNAGCHVDFLPVLAPTTTLPDCVATGKVLDLCETRLANGRRALTLGHRYDRMRKDGFRCVACDRGHTMRDDGIVLVVRHEVPPSEGVAGVVRTYCVDDAPELIGGTR